MTTLIVRFDSKATASRLLLSGETPEDALEAHRRHLESYRGKAIRVELAEYVEGHFSHSERPDLLERLLNPTPAFGVYIPEELLEVAYG